VTLPYTSSSSSLTVLRIDDENDTTWEQLGGASFEGGTATVEVAHFSILAVAETSGGSTLLVGVYDIDSYQSSPSELNACDQLTEVSPPQDMLVLYPFVPNNQMDAILSGTFCQSVDHCREVARNAPAPVLGYSFHQGNDQDGWLGFGIAGQSTTSADQCVAEAQVHKLTSSGDSISIRTDAVEVVFPPQIDGNQASCHAADAIAAFEPGLPCKYRFLLDATHAADLGGSSGSGGTGGHGGVGGTGATGGETGCACVTDETQNIYANLEYVNEDGAGFTGTDAASEIGGDCLFGTEASDPVLPGCRDETLTAFACFPACPQETIHALEDCVAQCTQDATAEVQPPGLSNECVGCTGRALACLTAFCPGVCAADSSAPPCIQCRCDNGCIPEFYACSGLPPRGECGGSTGGRCGGGGTGGHGGMGGGGGTGGVGGPMGCVLQNFRDEPDVLIFPLPPQQAPPGSPVEFSVFVDSDTRLVKATMMGAHRLDPTAPPQPPSETMMMATSGNETLDFAIPVNSSGRYYVDMELCGSDCDAQRVVYTLDRALAGEVPSGSPELLPINNPYERILYVDDVEAGSSRTCDKPRSVAIQN
jgi:hypothetical protein